MTKTRLVADSANDNSILGSRLEDNSITGAKLEDGTVTDSKLGTQKYVNVLDYGADPTGATDSTQAFTDAMNASVSSRKIVFMPSGVYLINNLQLKRGVTFEGSTPLAPMNGSGNTELRPSSGNSIFVAPEGGVQQVTLRNFRARATGAGSKLYTQTNFKDYSAYMLFENIDSYLDFQISYEGNFIFTRWRDCVDGYNGNQRGSGHHFIVGWPGTFNPISTVNQLNINCVEDCYIFRSWGSAIGGVSASVVCVYGWNFSFWRCDFELTNSPAVHTAGCNGIYFYNCWFESNNASSLIEARLNGGDNVQGARVIVVDKCFLNLQSLSQNSVGNTLFNLTGGTGFCKFTNNTIIRLSNDLKISNFPNRVYEDNNYFAASTGETDFFAGSLNRHVFNANVTPLTDNNRDLGSSTNRWSNTFSQAFRPGSGSASWTSGTGSPEGSVTAAVGSLFTRTDGGAGSTLYVKESGAGNTGWVAK